MKLDSRALLIGLLTLLPKAHAADLQDCIVDVPGVPTHFYWVKANPPSVQGCSSATNPGHCSYLRQPHYDVSMSGSAVTVQSIGLQAGEKTEVMLEVDLKARTGKILGRDGYESVKCET